MSILINSSTRIIIQGITGREGGFHAKKMLEYNPKSIVGGVTPGKGGTSFFNIPVFNSVFDAIEQTQANTSVIFVPASFAKDAIMEAADAEIELIICITEGIPTLDVVEAYRFVNLKGVQLIGPNCPGLITPGKCLAGILPTTIFKEGGVGVISRSGTLTYEIVHQLTQNDLGQSTVVGIGGDPIVGLSFSDLLQKFQDDNQTEVIVLIGEIGGDAEEQAAEYIKRYITKPVVAYIVGRTAPLGKQMGHAGAIITSGKGTAEEKIIALERVRVPVVLSPSEIPDIVNRVLMNSEKE